MHGGLSDVRTHLPRPQALLTYFNQRKILIGDNGEAMICDFGLSRIQHEITRTLTTICEEGKLRFLAPELTNGPEAFRTSSGSDIYSLSMVFLALTTLAPPFSDMSSWRAAGAACNGMRPGRPETLPFPPPINDQLWLLMQHMWAQEPAHRPSAPSVVKRLKETFHISD